MFDRRLLVVEDDPDIVEVLKFNLQREGFETLVANDGRKAIELADSEAFDLVLLDLMIPEFSGLEVCQKLRQTDKTKDVPIIMLTAKVEESDIVLGLQMGADDYVTKPFRPKELVARINGVLRRASKMRQNKKESKVAIGPLQVDVEKFEASLDGSTLSLTRSEFLLLFTLAANQGRVLTRDQLINEIRGDDVHIVDRNIDVHITSLRKKLQTFADHIITVRGVGYRFKD